MATNQLLKHDRLSKGALWNILGQIIPSLAAIIAIPKLLHGMGIDRFGLLTICWMVSGYFSLLDFGVGRALTQKVATNITKSNQDEVTVIIKNALLSSVLISIILALVLLLISNFLIQDVLHISNDLAFEARVSFLILAFSLPIMIGAASLRGVLESLQRFDLINLVRVPTSTLSFIAPLFILPYTSKLHWILLSLILFRAATFFLYWTYCVRIFPSLGVLSSYKSSINKLHITSLLKTGGWMTVSSVISPIMSQMDRFFIGNILTISVVANYTTPYEMVSKIWIVTGAIAGVIFPAIGTSLATQSQEQTTEILNKGTRSIVILVLPIVVLFILFAKEGLSLWLGPEMSTKTLLVAQILAVGFFFNSIANVPFAYIQAGNRADLTAKIHILEVFIYVPLIILLVSHWGVEGAAAAWLLRALIDLLLLSFCERTLFNSNRLRKTLLLLTLSTAICSGFYYLSLILSLSSKMALGALTLFIIIFMIRKWSLSNRIFLPIKGPS